MSQPHAFRVTPARAMFALAAAVAVAMAAAISPDVAQGRVDPARSGATVTVMSPSTDGKATGGGTIEITLPMDLVASFGINGKRPAGFTGGIAQGRINYDKHAQVPARHVNVPVTFMNVELRGNPSPNGTGGSAQLIGDCTTPGAECPSTLPATQSVLVYVEDNSDPGAGDVFQISYCSGVAASPTPAGCGPAEGGPIRSGNIQIRASTSGGSSNIPTAARAPLRLP